MCVGSKATVCYTQRNTKSSSHHLRVRTRPRSVSTPPFFLLNPPKGLVTVGTTCCPLTGHFLQCRNAECHCKRCAPAFWQTSEGSRSTTAEAHMPLFGFPPSPFAPSYRERQKSESREGRKRARVSYQSSHKVWEVSGYQPAVSFCRPHGTPVKRTDTHTSLFFFQRLEWMLRKKNMIA